MATVAVWAPSLLLTFCVLIKGLIWRYKLTCRCSTFVVPSSRRYRWPWKFKKPSKTFNILVICVKISTLWSPDFKRWSKISKVWSLPKERTGLIYWTLQMSDLILRKSVKFHKLSVHQDFTLDLISVFHWKDAWTFREQEFCWQIIWSFVHDRVRTHFRQKIQRLFQTFSKTSKIKLKIKDLFPIMYIY